MTVTTNGPTDAGEPHAVIWSLDKTESCLSALALGQWFSLLLRGHLALNWDNSSADLELAHFLYILASLLKRTLPNLRRKVNFPLILLNPV